MNEPEPPGAPPTSAGGGESDAAIKVAIIGGGCAALTAAFELTRPEQAGRFQVTVYQMGWRLGGKGASGRGPQGRIEEHGLHLWMGYYENAFRVMRECYAELQQAPEPGFPWRFEQAFSPANHNGAMDWSPREGWLPWQVHFPAMPGVPGDPNPPLLSVVDCLVHAVHMLGTLLSTLPVVRDTKPQPSFELGRAPLTPETLGPALQRLAKYAAVAGAAAALEGLAWLESWLRALPSVPQSLVAGLVDLIARIVREELTRLSENDHEVRRLLEVAELLLATIRGAIRFRLAFDPRGFDAIDDYDCREWLRLNGASQTAIDSAFIRALYDLAFAFEEGDPRRPAIAAGSAIRGAFRAFFSYRGAFFWKLNAGMGDVVFAPLYEILRRRGVRFEFFHKLTDIELASDADGTDHAAALSFDVQARTRSGQAYQPLVEVRGLACWPARPLFEQLVDGESLEASGIDWESQWDRRDAQTRRLRVGVDYDLVVLGVGLGVLPAVCSSIIERHTAWRTMLDHVKSVPTQAFQLWLDRDAVELGWTDQAINISGFVEPFDTWADLTHLAQVENWQQDPRSIAYFCSVLPEQGPRHEHDADGSAYLAAAHELVRANAVRFLEQDSRYLWPGARDASGGFCWSMLRCDAPPPPAGAGAAAIAIGPERFSGQFWTANVRPSDRYSQALPGTTRYRISPLDRTLDNLTVAGDWTSSGINMGCVEAAVMSGMLAAHALSGKPALEQIVGYDHP